MSAVEILDQCERTGLRRVKVTDSELILQVSLSGKVKVEVKDNDPPSATWGVYVMSGGKISQVGWKHTQSAANAVCRDLTSLGVTCWVKQISPPQQTSAQ